jgi:lysophospholipase L1-like esterase
LPRTSRPPTALLFTLLSTLFLHACGDDTTPVTPTPDPAAPKLTCPSAISMTSPLGSPVAVVYSLPTVSGGLAPLVGPTCTPSTGSNFAVGSTTVACTVTDAKARADVCTFAVTVTVPARLSVSRFVAFGDSITWGEDGRNSSSASAGGGQRFHPEVQFDTPNTYPGALTTDLDARYTGQLPQVANRGSVGEQVLDPGTFPRFTRDTAGAYDVVLLMEGANDLAPTTSASTIAAGLGRMIDNARSRGLKVYLATIPPENASSPCMPRCRGGNAGLVPPFNDQVRALAASKGVPLVDVFQAFNGDVVSLIGPDGLHPSEAGYHRIADTFFTAIKQTLEITATPTATPFRMPFVSPHVRR